jgi:hypothetical protein
MLLFSPRPLGRPFDSLCLVSRRSDPNLLAWSGGIIPEDKMKEHSRKIRSLAVFVGIGRDAITP